MKKQQESGIRPWALLTVPVLWAAAIMAYAYEDGMNIFDLLGRFTVLVERPFAIGWTAHQGEPAPRRGAWLRPLGQPPAALRQVPG